MKHIFKIIFGIIFLIAFSAQADLYTAQNVEMSGIGANPVEAKNNAITMGELKAFDQVLTALIGQDNQALMERPSDDEILGYVRDISILEEKNTATSYWGKMDVRFKEKLIQEFLQKNNQVYIKNTPPIYWVIPIWKQGENVWTLEDENPFYQVLKTQGVLSDFFSMILPNGDVDEMIAVTNALDKQDFSDVKSLSVRNRAEQILVIALEYAPDGRWRMKPESYVGTENAFYGLSVSGIGVQSLLDGWKNLNNKMGYVWREKNVSAKMGDMTYYARFNLTQISEWLHLEKELKKIGFLKNIALQGAMPRQILLRFNYADSLSELINQLDKAGFIWEPDSAFVGTLKRKEIDEKLL